MRDYATYIKQNVSISEVVERAGIKLKANSAICPFHDENTPSFHIHPVKNIYKCFGCGVGGDVISFVQRFYSVDFMGAVKLLNDNFGLGLNLTRHGRGKKMPVNIGYAVRRAYRAKFKRFELALLFYRRQLYFTILGYSAPSEIDLFDDEYIKAINRIDIVDYWLDIMTYGNDEDKKDLINDRGVKDIERYYRNAGF